MIPSHHSIVCIPVVFFRLFLGELQRTSQDR
jgi:hypothetical protein